MTARTGPLCVIRKFHGGDQDHIQKIITSATMEQVGNFFWGALLSELLAQISIALFGISFVFIGIPFKLCLLAVPLTIVLLYLAIWMGHWIKANELSNDIFNIATNYMNDPYTCFFVAEVYGKSGEAEMASLMNKVKKVEYDFYNEKEFEVQNVNISGLSRTIVGSIAVTRSIHDNKRAWLRRMAVQKEYRRRHIATQLLLSAIKFCEEIKYTGIDLITTSCHHEAKLLYSQEGFKVVETSTKNFIGFGANQDLYRMYRPINIKESNGEEDPEFQLGLIDV